TLKEAQSIRSTRIAEVSAAGAKESAKTHGKMNFTDVGVQLQKKAWNNAMDPKIGASVAVKNLATSVWGSDVLLTRTVTGVPSNANKDKEPRPPLTPKKVAFLRGFGEGRSGFILGGAAFTGASATVGLPSTCLESESSGCGRFVASPLASTM
ncbi:hypothetical protein HPB47_013676, partial [Ixodes persulcatus]